MASLSVSLECSSCIYTVPRFFCLVFCFHFFQYSKKECPKIRKLNRVKDDTIKAVEDKAPPSREILHSLVQVKSRKKRGRVYQFPFNSSMFVFNFNTVKKEYS